MTDLLVIFFLSGPGDVQDFDDEYVSSSRVSPMPKKDDFDLFQLTICSERLRMDSTAPKDEDNGKYSYC